MSADPPTVAVVVPVHDVAPFVDEALGSIARQTHPADEVIVVDDASTDRTADLVECWADRLPLRLIRLDTNVGCGMARAIAIRHASSDVIAPFDGDDVWLPNHLELTLPVVGRHTIAATKPLAWTVEEDSDQRTPAWHEIPPPEQQPSAILGKNFLFSGSLYWRSTLLDEAGGPSERRRGEDRETWIRLLCRAGCRAETVSEPTVLYRQLPDSLSANEGSLDGVIEILQSIQADPCFPVDRTVLRRSLRRLRARRRFLDALEIAAGGDTSTARRMLLAAAWEDRRLEGGMAPAEQGSVTLRSLVSLGSPKRASRHRRNRLPDRGGPVASTER